MLLSSVAQLGCWALPRPWPCAGLCAPRLPHSRGVAAMSESENEFLDSAEDEHAYVSSGGEGSDDSTCSQGHSAKAAQSDRRLRVQRREQ